jgi:hypothetical protein
MNKLAIVTIFVAFFSHNIFASSPSSVELQFNDAFGDIETYQIPDSRLSAEQNLNLLTSPSIEFACFNGDPLQAMRQIDSLVTDGGAAVTRYERLMWEDQLRINISFRVKGKVQAQEILLDACLPATNER